MDGKSLNGEILSGLAEEVKALDKVPTLCVIQVGDDEASNVYINQKRKMCNDIGYNFIHEKYDDSITEDELLKNIERFNSNDNIDAIIVQMPLPSGINFHLHYYSSTLENYLHRCTEIKLQGCSLQHCL